MRPFGLLMSFSAIRLHRRDHMSQPVSSCDLKKHTQRRVALSFITAKHNHPLQTLLPPIKGGTRLTKHRERYSAQQILPPATASINHMERILRAKPKTIHPSIHVSTGANE